MLNILAQNRQGIQSALALIEGHHKFLVRNTGLTNNAQLEHYVVNPDGVLSNNRHFIAASQMEYQPNGDGTTEGQSLQILGYCYAYLATLKQEYLDKAIWYFDAYVNHYYAGDPIPETPQRWISNWIVNSKEPVLSNWPIDVDSPTHSGFKASLQTYTNGICKIPHGAPHWGQYLDKAVQAYDGTLTWDAINATVQKLNPDGSTNWAEYGLSWEVEWIINWEGKKIDWNGVVLSTGHAEIDKGTVALKDRTVQGVHKTTYGNRQPVEYGGMLIPRNAVQHNRPLHVPLLGGTNQRGNAADGEEWFMDACYLLWKITGEARYKKAMDSCEFTLMEYTHIDRVDRFFRQTTDASTPFTDGISYDFTYPSDTPILYGRDAQGYITAACDVPVSLSLEQQAVWFRIKQTSAIRNTYGGLGRDGSPLVVSARIQTSIDKDPEKLVTWSLPLPISDSADVKVVDAGVSGMIKTTKDDGSEYILADLRAVAHADAITSVAKYVDGIIDGRSGMVVESFFPNDDPWYTIGNWLLPGEKAPILSITYKADADFNLRFADDNLWRWWWMLPNTNGQWVTKQILKSAGTLSGYQPDRNGRPDPAAPVYDEISQFSILFDDSSTVNATFSYYCVNEIPPRYTAADGYIMNYRLSIDSSDAMDARIGDCTVIDPADNSLRYTPGVIPFSNIYEEGTEQIGAWHGMPYPGYQYPFIYSLDSTLYSRELSNMIDFLYDAQEAYADAIGVMGPVAAAYIWDRWDNYKYGPPDTFTMYHWGDGTPWSGYQPRAFQGACRAWQELKYQGKPVPVKLQVYVNRWLDFLADFLEANDRRTPTEFPPNAPPYADPTDYTGHMAALWLAGATMAGMGGCTHPRLDYVIEACYADIANNYINTGIPNQVMNGSWSPAVRLETGNGVESNGMFFGFWSGETLRALGMYILYKSQDPNKPIY